MSVRRRSPLTRVEVLIPDCKGDPSSLAVLFAAEPDVLSLHRGLALRHLRDELDAPVAEVQVEDAAADAFLPRGSSTHSADAGSSWPRRVAAP